MKFILYNKQKGIDHDGTVQELSEYYFGKNGRVSKLNNNYNEE